MIRLDRHAIPAPAARVMHRIRVTVCCSIFAWLVVAPAAHASFELGDDSLGLIVPAYFYPGGAGLSYWQDMNAAAADVPLIAIMNPASGPGNNIDSNYTSAVNNLRAAGGTVIGYVSTSYANRSAALIKSDIDAYRARYNLDGIFLDEFTNTNDPADLAFYQDLYGYIKNIDPTWTVVGNPGTRTTEPYASLPAADVLVVQESFASNYATYTPSLWNGNYPAERLSHLVHTQPSAIGMIANLDQAVAQNAGWVYITDDVLNNPWDRLPTYWDAQVQRVKDINAAGVGGGDPTIKPGGLELRFNPIAPGGIDVTDAPGDRSGWGSAEPYSNDPALDAGPQVDFVGLTAAHDDQSVFFRVTRDASAAAPLGINQNIFLDVDQDRSTGFIGGGGFLPIGVDYLIQGSTLYSFANGTNQQAWGWNSVASLNADGSPSNDVELAVSRALLGDPIAIDLVLNAANVGAGSAEDYFPDSAGSGGYFTYALIALPLAGDFNGSGSVEQGDLDLVLNNWGAATTPSTFRNAATLTDGVDQDELDAVLNNWGSSAAPSIVGLTVPEPAVAGLIGLLVTGMSRRRAITATTPPAG